MTYIEPFTSLPDGTVYCEVPPEVTDVPAALLMIGVPVPFR
ncbi:MAG TPA: hypothetical protein VHO29_18440 [Marmoricola sp.]|nr:hypothetical protein [Marmoricola sp.]